MDANIRNLGEYFPFWDSLTEAQRSSLAGAAVRRSAKKGSMLHRGADDCEGLMLVVSGQLRAYMLTDEGRELTLYRLLERDMCLFSASCMLNGIQFDVLVSAAEDSQIISIPADVYKRLMDGCLAVSNYTNELMASHFSEVMWLMDQILSKKLDSRLAALLLEESSIRGVDTLAITHEYLGNHLGSVREVITRMLKYFQTEKLVALGRSCITLTDKDRLGELAAESLR